MNIIKIAFSVKYLNNRKFMSIMFNIFHFKRVVDVSVIQYLFMYFVENDLIKSKCVRYYMYV